MKKKRKGQGLVEFALIIPIFMVVIMGVFDLFPLLGNLYAAKQMSARGARAASVWKYDDSQTCINDVNEAVGDPWLWSAEWQLEMIGDCDDTGSLRAALTGDPMTVKIEVTYTPLILGGFGWPPKDTASSWTFTVQTTDQAR